LQILRNACHEAARWKGIKLSVNLSPVQFRSPTLVQDILAVLEETGFPAQRLELEVTEGYLIEHKDRAQPLIETLHAAGITIALDDFGTGYSSIGYLREYAFDRLKIDKSLVRGLATDSAAQSIILATAILARSLSLKITAEGVESEDEANLLRLAGCCNLQGYHFGKPQPADSITRSLAEMTRAASGM
jgi:EAL domain-containing protein (putative c-di-GMP-specific phosphodiesterase class I)